jgi:hypothetical protein
MDPGITEHIPLTADERRDVAAIWSLLRGIITEHIPLTADERRDAVAIASLLGVEPDENFQYAAAYAARAFVRTLINRTDPEGWRDVLGRIADGPASAAEIIARRGTLPDWQAEIITDFLEGVKCFEPPAFGDAVTITRIYAHLADQARAMLEQAAPRKRGRREDLTLTMFMTMLVRLAYFSPGRDRLERISRPGPFVEGAATALAQAIVRTRAEIDSRDDLSAEHCKAALEKLDVYERLTDDALRKRIREFLAGFQEARGAADANRAKARI